MAVTRVGVHKEPNGVAKLRQPSRLRLVDDVAESLEDAILAGRMRPGDRLIETRLCSELGVSRTTLREALLMLERRGLVRGEPRRGTFVTRLSRTEARDLCLARALLEAYAVTAGYQRLDESAFARLEHLIDRMDSLCLPEDTPDLIQLDRAFHELLVQVADSARVKELWSSLNGQMSALILSSIEHHHASAADVAGFHRVLVFALRSGAVEIAKEAVIAHYIGNEPEGEGHDSETLEEIAGVIEAMARHAGSGPSDG